ncbi:YraN family protein [Paenibacillus sp. MMS20-IR301]|uniref:YraN family protein n=1 Tax=Paenibacillus sp. MMS20-IR301 TaxID=2895946 RepID=UPI0028E1E101|nr:YraN family protein [Paenibacillus sp. MMS20-IR301]WNS44770.1 YraN family protein [Paenibacillus sp. MMS20-IR301]
MKPASEGEPFSRKQKGAAAEQAACLYLSTRGYLIRECNWRCRSGELDVIAEHEGEIVFVEVRSRSGAGVQGTAEESVDNRKIRQVRNTAQVYLHMKALHLAVISFDVIAVQLNPDLSVASLRHIRKAF